MARICVGVDGGGTKTEAVVYVVDEGADASSGRVVGRGVAGPSNKNSVGDEAAVAAFRQAVSAALEEQQSGGAAAISCVVLSMAGVDTEADARFWRKVGLCSGTRACLSSSARHS
jgi:N-acetylglucosamine kinase-like BadF-type ATPase